MQAIRVAIVAFLIIVLLNCAHSHDGHDHEEKHQKSWEGRESLHQKQISKLMHDLEKFCHGKDHHYSKTSIDTHRHGNLSEPSDRELNFSISICAPLLGLLDERGHEMSTEPWGQEQHLHHEHAEAKAISLSTWGYAFLACIVISLVGLLAVAVIPLMHKVIYNHLLQFLVSLAIGSLSGDALLHLIPHAIAPHDHHHHHEHEFHDLGHGGGPSSRGLEAGDLQDDRRPVWLGLMALGGLFVFFIVERLVGYCSEARRKRNKGEKYRTTDVSATNGMMADAGGDRKEVGGRVAPSANNGTSSCEEMLMVIHASKDIKKMAYEAQEEMHKNCEAPGVDQAHLVHSRGSHHHHSHEVPGSVAAVAWMVIVGDGFHNFADGLAIGSAFASSVQDGLSTAIAIFCHELPHELGDFAMLLSAGMSGKQALVYNCVSSILCLVGMCVGVGISNLISATPWIFMAIAGMFIYIALVDMLPEMKSVDPKRGEHPLLHLGLQVMGMLTGCSIMLIIALFEHQITIAV